MAEQQSVQLAEEIHKASKMGMLASQIVMTKTQDKNLQYDLNQIITVYRSISDKAQKLLPHNSKDFENEPVIWGTVDLTGLPDSSPSRIAEILINGCTIDNVETTKMMNEDESTDPSPKVLAKEMTEADQNAIEALKKYL